MFSYEMVSTLIALALTAIILHFLKNHLSKMRRPFRVSLIILAVLIFFTSFTALFRSPKLKAVIMTKMDHTYPTRMMFTEKMEHLGMGPAISQGMVRSGLKLLDSDDLIIWNNLRLKLCERSDKFCAALWTGEVSDHEIYEALSLFDDDEMDEWVRICKTSTERTLKKSSTPDLDVKDFHRGIRELSLNLSNIDQQKLKLALLHGEKANVEEAMFAMKTILRNSRLDLTTRVKFIRYLAAL